MMENMEEKESRIDQQRSNKRGIKKYMNKK